MLIGEKPVSGYSRDTLEKELGAVGYLQVDTADQIDETLGDGLLTDEALDDETLGIGNGAELE